MRRLIRRFSTPRGPWLAALIGVALSLPALSAGLVGDDYLWWLILQDRQPFAGELHPLWHVYNFIPGGVQMDVLQGQGLVTWWADPELSIALLRPLTVLTFLLDHAVAPDNFVVQHAHSLLWYGLAVASIGLVYRRIHPGAGMVAGLAVLLFAVEDAHAMSAGWIANRHVLLSTVLGAAMFLAHVRWRTGGGVPWLAASMGLLALGMLSGEAALGAAAYLVAWQLCLDRGGWGRRFAGIVPAAVVVLVWRLLYDHFGFGITGSDLYIDPGAEPLKFLGALVLRWPMLLAGQWLQAPIDVAMFFVPWIQGVAVAVLMVPLAALAWVVWPLLRARAEARFWALGMALSLVPLAAAFPMDRLLAFAGVGAFGLLAMQVQALGWLSDDPSPPVSRLRRWPVAGLLVLHLPLAALLLFGRTAGVQGFGVIFAGGDATTADEPETEQQVYIFVTGHEFPTAYTPIIREAEGRHRPLRTQMLSSFIGEQRVTREDEHTLVIESQYGFVWGAVDRLERRLSVPFEVGETVGMPDFDAEVRTLTDDARPKSVAFRFREPLDSPLYRLWFWGPFGAEPFELPPVGGEVVIPTQTGASLMLAQ
jgi:hypothetical protein